MKYIWPLCFVFVLLPAFGADWSNQDVLKEALSDEQTLYTKDGRSYQGRILSTSDSHLSFRQKAGQGTVEYEFALEDIRDIQFPGNQLASVAEEFLEQQEHEAAISVIDALYRQRVQYLNWQREEVALYLTKLVDLQLEYGSPYAAIGAATNLLPHVHNPTAHNHLVDTILLAHFKLPLEEKTMILADEWIETRQADGHSALGWYIKAHLLLDDEQWEAARDVSLKPIVFSSQIPMAYLEHCYAIAIRANHALETFEYAEHLKQEMDARSLVWPDTIDFLENKAP